MNLDLNTFEGFERAFNANNAELPELVRRQLFRLVSEDLHGEASLNWAKNTPAGTTVHSACVSVEQLDVDVAIEKFDWDWSVQQAKKAGARFEVVPTQQVGLMNSGGPMHCADKVKTTPVEGYVLLSHSELSLPKVPKVVAD